MCEDFSDLKVGDEVAVMNRFSGFSDPGPTILKVVRRTDKTAWVQWGEGERSFRLKDGGLVGQKGRVQRVTEEIRRQAASAKKRDELRDLVYHLDNLDELKRDLNHEFVDRLHAALSPFAEEIDRLYQLSQKRRY